MTDTRSPAQRSKIMAAVKSKDTGPERAVRKILHALGHRYRLHRRDLPGTPDIAMIGRRKAIFVHGCFWHGHGCSKGRLPKTEGTFWSAKVERNRARDTMSLARLSEMGWSVLTIWQCELKDVAALTARLRAFASGPAKARLPDGSDSGRRR
jgi:DNA mismatch endonuclease (patch repair protein)